MKVCESYDRFHASVASFTLAASRVSPNLRKDTMPFPRGDILLPLGRDMFRGNDLRLLLKHILYLVDNFSFRALNKLGMFLLNL